MAKLTPTKFAERWAQRLGAAGQAMKDGADRVTTAPGLLAAAKQDKMRTNILAAIDNGKWARNVSAVSLDEWRSKFKLLGVARAASGATAAQSKMAAFAAELFPAIEAAQAEIADMSDIGLENNILRMVAYIRKMGEFKYK